LLTVRREAHFAIDGMNRLELAADAKQELGVGIWIIRRLPVAGAGRGWQPQAMTECICDTFSSVGFDVTIRCSEHAGTVGTHVVVSSRVANLMAVQRFAMGLGEGLSAREQRRLAAIVAADVVGYSRYRELAIER
jgi:hypothetical protein